MSKGGKALEAPTCPLCLEELSATERNFRPCKCGYQVCLWCYQDIKEKLNGRCPACRAPYQEKNFQFTAPDPAEVKREFRQRRQAAARRKKPSRGAGLGSFGGGLASPDKRALAAMRVLQRNLMYVVGLTVRAAKEESLRKRLAAYGTILKVVSNKKVLGNGAVSYCAYVTFQTPQGADSAIRALNGSVVDSSKVKATYGTTKYCTNFLRGSTCSNPNCLYLHELAPSEDSFSKEDLSSVDTFNYQQLLELSRSHAAAAAATATATTPKEPAAQPQRRGAGSTPQRKQPSRVQKGATVRVAAAASDATTKQKQSSMRGGGGTPRKPATPQRAAIGTASPVRPRTKPRGPVQTPKRSAEPAKHSVQQASPQSDLLASSEHQRRAPPPADSTETDSAQAGISRLAVSPPQRPADSQGVAAWVQRPTPATSAATTTNAPIGRPPDALRKPAVESVSTWPPVSTLWNGFASNSDFGGQSAPASAKPAATVPWRADTRSAASPGSQQQRAPLAPPPGLNAFGGGGRGGAGIFGSPGRMTGGAAPPAAVGRSPPRESNEQQSWEEGLRALLPDVEISFTGSLGATQTEARPPTWPAAAAREAPRRQQQQQQQQQEGIFGSKGRILRGMAPDAKTQAAAGPSGGGGWPASGAPPPGMRYPAMNFGRQQPQQRQAAAGSQYPPRRRALFPFAPAPRTTRPPPGLFSRPPDNTRQAVPMQQASGSLLSAGGPPPGLYTAVGVGNGRHANPPSRVGRLLNGRRATGGGIRQ